MFISIPYFLCLEASALIVIFAMHVLFINFGYYVITWILQEWNYHNLFAWMNFFPTRKKSFSWWVVSCIMLKNVFYITISAMSMNSSFSNIHS